MQKFGIYLLLLTALHAGAQGAQAEITAPEHSVFPHWISPYEPTYLLPAYNTFSPDNATYGNTLPNGQSLNTVEVKMQFSGKIPFASSGLLKNVYFAYTQLSYWQPYRDSAFFRETDYQPELLIAPDDRWDIGGGWIVGFHVSPFVHQSNGRGGSLERSWDRTSADFLLERLDGNGDGWKADLRGWGVWHDDAYRRYNPDLANFLGYFRPAIAYRHGLWEFTLNERNQIESGFRRGSVETSLSYACGASWMLYLQYFNGYGQSLIEYNHSTNALGLGVALRTW